MVYLLTDENGRSHRIEAHGLASVLETRAAFEARPGAVIRPAFGQVIATRLAAGWYLDAAAIGQVAA